MPAHGAERQIAGGEQLDQLVADAAACPEDRVHGDIPFGCKDISPKRVRDRQFWESAGRRSLETLRALLPSRTSLTPARARAWCALRFESRTHCRYGL